MSKRNVIIFADERSAISTDIYKELQKQIHCSTELSLIAVVRLKPISIAEKLHRFLKRQVIKIFQPEKYFAHPGSFTKDIKNTELIDCHDINSKDFLRHIKSLQAEYAILISCGFICNLDFINSFSRVINYHNSFLPAYRGIEATSWEMFFKEQDTGFSFHYIDKGIDTGKILIQEQVPLNYKLSPFENEKIKNCAAIRALPRLIKLLENNATGKKQTGKASYFGSKAKKKYLTFSSESNPMDIQQALKIWPWVYYLKQCRSYKVSKLTENGSIKNIEFLPYWLFQIIDIFRHKPVSSEKTKQLPQAETTPYTKNLTSKKVGLLAWGMKNSGGIRQYALSVFEELIQDTSMDYVLFCDNDELFDSIAVEKRIINNPHRSSWYNFCYILALLLGIKTKAMIDSQDLDKFNDIDQFFAPKITAYPHFFLKKKYIFTLHDMQERYYPEFIHWNLRLGRYIRNSAISRNASAIICESSFVKNDITKFIKYPTERIHIIPAPPTAGFKGFHFDEAVAERVRTELALPEKYIFYPAQSWPHKNHLNLLKSISILKKDGMNINLVLCGGKLSYYTEVIEKQIEKYDLKEDVYHLGYVQTEYLPYIYKLSTMLVMPSLFESISIPIYEAFSLKIPVCSSNVTALPEQVGDAGLLFDPNDPQDIATKLKSYLSNTILLQEKAEKGFKKICKFDYPAFREKTARLFR